MFGDNSSHLSTVSDDGIARSGKIAAAAAQAAELNLRQVSPHGRRQSESAVVGKGIPLRDNDNGLTDARHVGAMRQVAVVTFDDARQMTLHRRRGDPRR